MSKILYRGFDILPKRVVGFADTFTYSLVCYLNGKLKGFDNIYIVFPRFGYDKRFEVSEEARHWQKTEFLPWSWIDRNKKVPNSDYDRVVYTNRPHSLYTFYPGLNHTGRYFYAYLDLYYLSTKREPTLNIPRENIKDPYVLLQYRDLRGRKSENRNTRIERLLSIYDILKKEYGDTLKYYKIGEPSEIDDKFDSVIPLMHDNIDGFSKIVRNASLMVSGHSGPQSFSTCFPDVPTIRLDMIKELNPKWGAHWKTQVKQISSVIPYHPMWCDKRLLDIQYNEKINENTIKEFLDAQKIYGI